MNKLRAIMGRRWLILVVTTVIGIGAGVLSSRMASAGDSKVERSYTASQTVIANRAAPVPGVVAQDVLRLTRGEVPQRAAKVLKYKGKPEDLASMIVATADNPSAAITVASDDVEPKAAERRVRAFVDAFVAFTSEQVDAGRARQAKAETDQLQAATDALAAFDAANSDLLAGVNDGSIKTAARIQERNGLAAEVDTAKARVSAIDSQAAAAAPYIALGMSQTKPAASGLLNVPASPLIRGFLLGVLGVLLGGVVIMLLERVDRRIDTRDELTELIDLPVLAEIGFVKQRKRHQDSAGALLLTGVWAEPYRRVRSAIHYVQAADVASPDVRHPQVFLITSTSPGEGKSTSAALTALALAEIGTPTLVVGGDFRKPMIDRLLGVAREPSVQDLAKLDLDRPTIDEIVHPTAHGSLYVAPAGPATREVARLIEAAKDLVEVGRQRGATVIIDSSPLQAANDTLDLLPVVDYVILVLRAGRSGETDLMDTVETMRRMGTRILGIVLIGTPIGRKQSYYYDYYSPESEHHDLDGSAPSPSSPVPGSKSPLGPPADGPNDGIPANGSLVHSSVDSTTHHPADRAGGVSDAGHR